MRALVSLLAMGLLAGPAPAAAALAIPQSALGEPGGLRIYSPGQFGLEAVTPSRIDASRREMNRSRNGETTLVPGPAAVNLEAASVVARAGLVCTVVEAAVVGRTRAGGDLFEVDCAEGGGVILADGDPVQVVDCLDLAPDTGQAPGRRQRVVTACRLDGNQGLARN